MKVRVIATRTLSVVHTGDRHHVACVGNTRRVGETRDSVNAVLVIVIKQIPQNKLDKSSPAIAERPRDVSC